MCNASFFLFICLVVQGRSKSNCLSQTHCFLVGGLYSHPPLCPVQIMLGGEADYCNIKLCNIKPLHLRVNSLLFSCRTSKTHWSMNTGIAALVACSGKVKMIHDNLQQRSITRGIHLWYWVLSHQIHVQAIFRPFSREPVANHVEPFLMRATQSRKGRNFGQEKRKIKSEKRHSRMA